MMSTPNPTMPQDLREREVRTLIDKSVSRAMFDREYAELLLADPTVLLGDEGCTPQQYLDLRSIRATNLTDFAQQAEALFWLSPQTAANEDNSALRAAAM